MLTPIGWNVCRFAAARLELRMYVLYSRKRSTKSNDQKEQRAVCPSHRARFFDVADRTPSTTKHPNKSNGSKLRCFEPQNNGPTFQNSFPWLPIFHHLVSRCCERLQHRCCQFSLLITRGNY
jgi:hypothetical protein